VGLDGGPSIGVSDASMLVVGFSVGVIPLVGLISIVALADGMSVFVGVGVVEGFPVGLGPIDGVTVGVGEIVGAMVDVKVGIGVSVCALVGVEVAAGVSDGAVVGVIEGGGERTVKEPLFNLTAIPSPLGSEAVALLSVKGEVPGAAPASTLKITLATLPLGIAF
jgi:hypothetical protein